MTVANHRKTRDNVSKQAGDVVTDNNSTAAARQVTKPNEQSSEGSSAWKKEKWK